MQLAFIEDHRQNIYRPSPMVDVDILKYPHIDGGCGFFSARAIKHCHEFKFITTP
jgi:hypothetical protein